MGRYVLLEFDDHEVAEQFVNDVIQRNLDLAKKKKWGTVKVKGYFARPEKYCECGPIPQSKVRYEITRGKKYGWNIHRKCRRARPGPQLPRNLLDPQDTPPRMMEAFLHLAGEVDGKKVFKGVKKGEPMPTFPISVKDRHE